MLSMMLIVVHLSWQSTTGERTTYTIAKVENADNDVVVSQCWELPTVAFYRTLRNGSRHKLQFDDILLPGSDTTTSRELPLGDDNVHGISHARLLIYDGNSHVSFDFDAASHVWFDEMHILQGPEGSSCRASVISVAVVGSPPVDHVYAVMLKHDCQDIVDGSTLLDWEKYPVYADNNVIPLGLMRQHQQLEHKKISVCQERNRIKVQLAILAGQIGAHAQVCRNATRQCAQLNHTVSLLKKDIDRANAQVHLFQKQRNILLGLGALAVVGHRRIRSISGGSLLPRTQAGPRLSPLSIATGAIAVGVSLAAFAKTQPSSQGAGARDNIRHGPPITSPVAIDIESRHRFRIRILVVSFVVALLIATCLIIRNRRRRCRQPVRRPDN